MVDFYMYLNRALEGERKEEVRHDISVFKACTELAKKHGIQCEPDVFVPDNEAMADALFAAAVELLSEVGIYCISTARTIRIDAAAIARASKAHQTLEIGCNRERVAVMNRRPEDPRVPVIIGGPMGGTVAEENFIAVHLSSAREPAVHGLYAGVIDKIGGKEIQGKSPMEMLAALREARLERHAANLAGRPGLCLMGPGTPTIACAYMVVSSGELYRRSDVQEVYQLDELKTDYETFQKSIFHQERGNHFLSGQCPVFGGPSIGSPEGLAIVDVAETLQSKVLTGASLHLSGAVHLNTHSSSSREILWASNLAAQALAQNFGHPKGRYYWNAGELCTAMMFYETAAQAVGDTASGRDVLAGPVGGRGIGIDQSSGIESRFMGDVARLATVLPLRRANEIVAELYTRYGNSLSDPPRGKTFSQCYEVRSEYEMEPTEEYLTLYRETLAEVTALCG